MLITGAAGDIGGATAVRLATAGALVGLADLADLADIDGNRALCDVANPSVAHEVIRFDVTDDADVQRAFDVEVSGGAV